MRFTVAAIAASLLLGTFSQTAHGADFVVDANLHSLSRSPAAPGIGFVSALLDTGIDVNAGDLLTITAAGQWRISGSDPFTDANGQVGRTFDNTAPWWVSSLLVQISDTPRQVGDPEYRERTFQAGTNFVGPASRSGRLFLAYGDTDYGNNEGSVTASVSVTAVAPEPGTLALLGAGLGMVGLIARRKR